MATILIVEDDLFLRELTEVIIQDWGHQTLVGSDVDEGLAIFRSSQHVDILFTDIYLKSKIHAGCELANQAIALRPDLRVLYTTGNFVTYKMQAMFIQGTQCLRKPYTSDQLHHSIDGLIAA
jgi:DNA-binding NtrC family response regulator